MRKLSIGIAAAALSLAAIAPVNAQGFWFGGPGFGVGVGFGPTYAYDPYPAYGYTGVGYWGGPAWGDAYATYAVEDDFAYAPAVNVGYGYEPAYRRRYSTARYAYPGRVSYRRSYAYPERVSYRQSFAYSPRASSRHFVHEAERRSGVRHELAVGSRTAARTSIGSRVSSSEAAGSRISSEGVHVRGGQSMARASRSEKSRASVTQER